MMTLNAVAETRRKRWCKTLESVDMRHDSRKSWELIRRLTNTPHILQTQLQVTPNQIAHTILLISKQPKTVR